MAYNKIVYGSTILIDLTADTVTAASLLRDVTAHDASGADITGTCDYDADTSDANATAAQILSGATAYVNGSKLTGSMANRGAVTGTISTVGKSASTAKNTATLTIAHLQKDLAIFSIIRLSVRLMTGKSSTAENTMKRQMTTGSFSSITSSAPTVRKSWKTARMKRFTIRKHSICTSGR